jgi:hypothetical protein
MGIKYVLVIIIIIIFLHMFLVYFPSIHIFNPFNLIWMQVIFQIDNWYSKQTTDSYESGQATSSTLLHLHTWLFFLRSLCCPRRKSSARLRRPRASCKFFLCSRYWIVARPLRGFSGTAFRTTGLARFVRRSRRPSATFSSAAPTAKRCGFACSGRQGSRYLTPSVELVLADWWIASRKRIQKLHRKGFDTLLLMVCWMLWNERNSRVFEGVSIEAVRLASLIRDEGRQWVAAGFGRLGDFIL